MNKITESPFHQGEQTIQQQLGVREKMERFGSQVIRNYMTDQHRDFFAQLPFIFAGHADRNGWPWATILFNSPGFISSNDKKRLLINTQFISGDPLNESLNPNKKIGLLGIELESRRRNRLSTHLVNVSELGIELEVDQSFGNCPQYIQSRELETVDPLSMPPPLTEKFTSFDQQAIELINASDTFFVASYLVNNNHSQSEGADVSHRGGKPGFVRIDDSQTLTIPDYLGNFHFNTLGNFLENPKAGLLFIDFTEGHLLTLTGRVEIIWDSAETEFFTGAERLWKFKLDHGYWLQNGLPLRWKLQEYSPNTQLTGNWEQAEAIKKAEELRNTWQPYQVIKCVEESSVIKSFYLQAPAGQKANFKPGQYLTLKTEIDGKRKIRTYTVSSAPDDPTFRISVKHEKGSDEIPAGIFSSFLHHKVSVGDTLLAKAPTGDFSLDPSIHRPAVLISAGVGITPMISMVRDIYHVGIRTRSMRPVTIICTARNASQRAFFDELNEIANQSAGHIKVFWAITQPEPHLQLGKDYHFQGRLTKSILQTSIPDNTADIYLCGPNSFMQSQYNIVRELGIADTQIFAEAFGPATLVRDEQPETVSETQLPVAKEAMINFTQSKVELAWSPEDGTLLEFAELHGINPAYGCRNGQCGSCAVKLITGKVSYNHPISASINSGEVLLCSCVPAAETDHQTSQLQIEC